MDGDGVALARDLRVGGLAPASLGRRHAVEPAERGHVVIGEPERGLNAHVVEALRVEELVGREAQVLAGDGEADEHRGAQHADGRDGQEAPEAAANRAQRVLCEGPGYHSISSMGVGLAQVVISVTRPLLKRTRRSAMGASAALCVMSTTVMPEVWHVSCRSLRICLPVR